MRQKIFLYMILLTAALMVNSAAFSQGADSENDRIDDAAYKAKISVTARGYQSRLTSTPGGIGVITADDLLYQQPDSISDALRLVPGVSKRADSSWGSDISIRGSSRSHVVMLVDGIRLNTATGVAAQFGTIDPMAVERIEILKGPISSLYGSGTIGGVVNIITRNGYFNESDKIDGGLNVSYNSNTGGFNTYAFTSYNGQAFYAFASGSYRDHGSFKDGNGDKMSNSQFEDVQGNFNLGYKINSSNILELKTQYYEGKDIGIPGSDNFTAQSVVSYPTVSRMLLNLNYTYRPVGLILQESKVKLSYHSIERNVLVEKHNPILAKIEPEADHITYGSVWTNILKAGDHAIVAGADAWMWALSSTRLRTKNNGETSIDTPIPDSWLLSTGIFAEDDWKVNKKIKLNFGGRFDRIQVQNDEAMLYKKPFDTAPPPLAPNRVIWDEHDVTEYSWNAHTGATYYITEPWSLTFLMARGYRAASLEERYKYINLGGGSEKWGDPKLEPEESLFSELGLHFAGRKIEAGAAAYYNRLKNLIAEVQVTPTRNEMQNIAEASLYGAEAEATLHLSGWLKVTGNMAYTRGEDTKNNEDLPAIAPLNGFFRVNLEPLRGLWANIDAVYNGSQKRVPTGTEESDQWTRFDAAAGYRFETGGMNHEIYCAIDNILDKEYTDYLTSSRGYIFNEPGRTYRVGYKMTF